MYIHVIKMKIFYSILSQTVTCIESNPFFLTMSCSEKEISKDPLIINMRTFICFFSLHRTIGFLFVQEVIGKKEHHSPYFLNIYRSLKNKIGKQKVENVNTLFLFFIFVLNKTLYKHPKYFFGVFYAKLIFFIF